MVEKVSGDEREERRLGGERKHETEMVDAKQLGNKRMKVDSVAMMEMNPDILTSTDTVPHSGKFKFKFYEH